MANQVTAPQPTEWDANGTPIVSPATSATSAPPPTEWDANGTPIVSPATSATSAPPSVGFWESAYQQSGVKGLIDSSKKSFEDAQAGRNEEVQTIKSVTDNIKAGNYGQAAESLLHYIAKTAPGVAQLAPIVESSITHGKEAMTDAKERDYPDTTNNAVAAIPVAGPIIDSFRKTGAQAYNDIKSRNYSGAAGDVVGGIAKAVPLVLGAGSAVGAADAGEALDSAAGALGLGKAAAEGADTADAGEALDSAADTVSNAFRKTGTNDGTTTETVSSNPVDIAAQKATNKIAAKTGMSAGAKDVPVENVQPTYNQGLRQVNADIADDNGVTPQTPAMVRDVTAQTAAQVEAKATGEFQLIDKASNGAFQVNRNAIDAVNNRLRNAASETDMDAALADKAKLMQEQQTIVDDAVNKPGSGVAQNTVANAMSDYKKSQALQDISAQERIATKMRPVNGQMQEVTNFQQLGDRIQKLSDSGSGYQKGMSRIEEAMGPQRAAQYRQNIQNAQLAEAGVPATDTSALRNLITQNTQAGKIFGTTVDWNKTLNSFDALSTEERDAMFTHPDAVRAALRTQATKQSLRSAATLIGAVSVPGIATLADILHHLT